MTKKVTASLSAVGYSDALDIFGEFNFSLSGTWVATVHVQRAMDGGDEYEDVESFTSNGQYTGYEPEGEVKYRFIIKTGNYTSGTVIGRLSKNKAT
ncbi:hypothetical protein KAR91_05905 [Candidatus Pacearchaeota archaeon]|nr:hypothetical protein [Candidatus Pacearchaeota archaeon]